MEARLRNVELGQFDGRTAGLDTGHPTACVHQRAGEQPAAAVQIGDLLPRLRVQAIEHSSGQGFGRARMHLPEPVGPHPVSTATDMLSNDLAAGQ